MENYYNSLNSGLVTWFKNTSTNLFGSSKSSEPVVSTFRNSYTQVLFVLLLVASLFGGQRLTAQTYFTESFEGAWYLNGNSSTPATPAGPNAPSGWTQSRPVNNVSPSVACATSTGTYDWGQQFYNGSSWASTGSFPTGCAPYNTSNPSAPINGSNTLWFYNGWTASGNTRLIATPAINLSASSLPIISFSYSYADSSLSEFVGSLDGGTTWNSLSTLTSTSVNTWVTKTITIPAAYKISTAKFGFRIASNYGSYDAYIDNVSIREAVVPNAAPSSFTSTAITKTGMTIGWTDSSTNENLFRVYRSTDNINFTQVGSDITSTTTAGTGTAYSLVQTGLVPGQIYYYRIAAVTDAESSYLTGNQTTTPGATYYWVGASGATWQSPNSWNTAANGSGSSRTQVATDDVLILDGAGITPGASTTIVLQASQTIGTLQITNNTAVSIEGYSSSTATITLSGGGGDELSIPSGSSLTLNHSNFPVAIAYTGTGNTGLIAGVLNLGGSGSNTLSTTSGTSTLVTVSGTINNGGIISTSAHITGSTATLVFTASGVYNHTYALGGVVPTAAWNAASNVNFTGLTSAATAVTGISGQTFGNVTWNPTSQGSAVINLAIGTTTIAGNLTIVNTGTGSLSLTAATTMALSVGGNYLQSAGYVYVTAGTSSGTVLVTGSTTIASGATLDLASSSANGTFRAAGSFTNNGTLTESGTSTASTLDFNGTIAQAVNVGTANNNITYRISNNAGVNLTGAMAIANGSGLIIASTASTPINGGTLTYASSGTTLTYNSSTGNQTVTANEWKSSGGPFNVTINNTTASPNNRVFLGSLGNRTISGGTFTQTSGVTVLDSSNLTIGITASLSGSAGSSNFIASNSTGRLLQTFSSSVLSRSFPLGDITGTDEASSVTLTYTFLNGNSTVGAGVTDAQHPNDASATNFLSRYFSFTESGAIDYTYSLTLNYPSGEVTGFTPLTRLSRWNGATWSLTNTTVVPSASSVSVTGVTLATDPLNNSAFTLRPYQGTYTWKGGVSGSFATATNWSPSRTTLDVSDILVFDGSNIDGVGGTGAVTASSVASQTIGKFLLTNNANVSLISNASATITLNGSDGTDFDIPAGSTLSLTGAQSVSFSHTLNASPNANTATIAGTFNLNTTSASSYSASNTVTTVTGTINNTTGSFTSSTATLVFGAAATYNHLFPSGGTVPTATWNLTSNLNFPGPNSSSLSIGGISGQTFGNFNWNPTAQGTASINLGISSSTTIAGNLTISSTGSSPSATQSNFGFFSTSSSLTLTVNGNFNFTSGYLVGATTGTASVLLVKGNATLASGTTYDLATGTAGTGYFRFNNALTNNGTITVTGTGTGSFVIFNGTSNQTVSLGNTSGAINYAQANDGGVNLNGGTLSIAASRTLQIATISTAPFTNGTVSYAPGAFLSYSAGVGNMFITDIIVPVTNGPTSLTINNTTAAPNNRVLLNTTGDRTLTTLTNTSGVLLLGNNSLTVSAFSGTPSSTNFVATNGTGQLKYVHSAIATVTYPVGDITGTDEVSTVVLNYTALPSSTVGVRVTDAQTTNDLSATNYLSRYYSFTETGTPGATYNLTLNYSSTDIAGTAAATKLNRWNGSVWNEVASTVPSSTSVAVTGVSSAVNGLNGTEFTLRPSSRNYVWTNATADGKWTTAGNWTPNRSTLTADVTDELTFDGATVASPIVTDVPTQTIGRLLLTNNANVTLQSPSNNTITIGGALGTDLDIPSGSTLNLNNALFGTAIAFTGTGNVGTIAGTLNLAGVVGNTFNTTGGTTVVTVTGTTNVGGSISASLLVGSASSLIYSGTAAYNHKYTTGGTIPTATWGATTNLNFPGPNDATTAISGFASQTFGNFNWNPTAQAAQNVNLALASSFTVAGNMTISSTGTTGSLIFATSGSPTITVTGNYLQGADTKVIMASTTGAPLLAIGGSTTITAGTNTLFDLSAATSATANGGILQTAGNFTNNGTITESGLSTGSIIRFSGSGAQSVAIGTVTPATTISYSLTNAAAVNLSGTITITPGASFNHASTGIFSGSGSVVYTGTGITTLTYTGSTPRTQGLEWPTSFGSTAPAIVINITGSSPNNRLTLSASRNFSPTTGTYTMTSGVTILGNNDLTLGSGVTFGSYSAGSGNFVATNGTGQFFKNYAGATSFTFPLGDIDGTEEASNFTLNYTVTPGASSTVGVRVIDAQHPNDTSVDNFVSRYFKVTETGAAGTAQYTATANYQTADFVGTPSFARMYRYNGSSFVLTTGSLAGIPSSTSTATAGNTIAADPLNNSDFTVRPYASTYTWIGATGGSWALDTNWSPTRSASLITPTDILIFNTTAVVTAVPTQTVGQILLNTGAAITLQAAAANNTLTVGGGAGTDLDIPSGTSLTLSGANAWTLAYGAGATANIAGTFTQGAAGGAVITHNLTGATVTVNGTYNNTGSAVNVLSNSSASNFVVNGNYNINVSAAVGPTVPTGTYGLASTVKLTVVGNVAASPVITSQNYGNFIIDNGTNTSAVLSSGSPITINGTLNIISAGGAGGSYSFGGNTVTVNGLTTLTTGTLTSAATTFNFNGGLTQNGGTITTSSTATINVGNASTPGVFTQAAAGVITQPTATANAITLNLFGDAAIAGTIQETSAATTGSFAVNFRKTISGVQNINTTGIVGQTGSFTFNSSNTPGLNFTGTLLINGATPPSTFTNSGLGLISGGTFTYGSLISNVNSLTYNSASGSQTVGSEWPVTNPPIGVIIQNTTLGINNRVFFSSLTGDRTTTFFTQTQGVLVLGNNSLTASALSGVAASNNFVATNGTGQLKFIYPSGFASSATFPIGDITNTDEASPVTLAYTNVIPTASTVGIRVTDAKHPNDASTTNDYLARYFSITESGATATSTATLTLNYPAANIVGNNLNTRLNRWNGSSWTQVGSAAASTTSISVAGIDYTALNGNDFTLRPVTTQTYTWAGGSSAAYNDPGSWNPNRFSTDPSDILIFDGAITPTTTATNVVTETIGKIVLQNNTNVTFTTALTTATLTINGGVGADLDIPSGSTLTLAGQAITVLNLAYGANTTANIAGNFNLGDVTNTSAAHTYNATNAVTTITSTGTFTNNNAAGGGTTSSAANFIINGTYVHNPSSINAGTIPTATVAATSTLNIRSGSSTAIVFPSTNAIGNLILNNIGGGSAAPSLGLTTATVQGNLTVNSTGNSTGGFAFGPSPTVTVNGTTTITAGKFDLANSTSVAGTFTALGNVVMNGGSIGSNNASTGLNVINVGNIGTPASFTMNNGSSITSASTATPSITLNLFGDLTMNSGSSVTETSTGGSVLVNFAKTLGGAQNVAFNGTITNSVLFRQSNTTGVNLSGTLTLDGGASPVASFTHLSTGVITGSGTVAYSGANSILTYNGSANQTAGLEWPSTGSPINVTINNTGATATTNLVAVPFSRTIGGTLTMTAGNIDLTSNSLTIGTSAASTGSLIYTAGTIRVTSGSLTRWYAAAGLPILPASIAAGFYPLANGVNNRAATVYFSAANITTGGTISASHTDALGLADVSFTDVAYNINKRTNASWTFTSGNGLNLGATTAGIQLKTAGSAAFAEVLTTNTNLRLVQAAAAASGAHVASASTASPTTFVINRTGLAAADLSTTYYIGGATSDFPNTYTAITNGDWAAGTTWDKGVAPGSTDTVLIPSPYTVGVTTTSLGGIVTINSGGGLTSSVGGTLSLTGLLTNNGTIVNAGTITSTSSLTNGASKTITNTGTFSVASTFTNNGVFTNTSGTANFTTSTLALAATGITNNTGSSFIIDGGTVNLGISDNTVNNRTFNNLAGTLTVTGGTFNVYGNIANAVNGFFNQSGGNINIDGNAAGVAANSVAALTPILSFANPNNRINLTGGTLTIVDPHTAATNTSGYAVFYSYGTAGAQTSSSAHTTRFGNGTSVDAGGHSNGFYINTWSNTALLSFGSVTVNGPSANNRLVSTEKNIPIKGDLTINTTGNFTSGNTILLGGNLQVNTGGTLTTTSAVSLQNIASNTSTVITAAPTTNTQSIGGTGTIQNAATGSTASFVDLAINNTNATGVTIASPLSVSGTLTMTSGLVNTTATNLLTLGTTAAAGTLVVTPSATTMIVGPFGRTFAASRTASGTYGATTLFPVGKGGTSYSLYIDPSTSAGGAVVFTGEAFATNSGTFSTPVSALAATRFEALPITGSTNLTNVFVRMSDATPSSIVATSKILQSTAAAGAYTTIIPATTAAVATSVTTTTAIAAVDYKGYFSYGLVTPCTSPTNQPTALNVFLKTTNTVGATFTAAASLPTGYLVVRYASGGTVTDPTDNVIYVAGAPLGAGTVVSYGTALNFTATSLVPSTTYDFYVYSYNNSSSCAGPVYLVTSPLTQTVTTCGTAVAVTGTPTASAILTTGFTAAWSASATTGVTYAIDVATDNAFTSFVSGYNNFNVGTGLNYAITGLTGSTVYYVRVRAVDALGCTSTNSGTLTTSTSCIGTPNAGVAAVATATGCPGTGAVSLSATGLSSNTGISYLWQSSPDNSTWTDITGATTASYNADAVLGLNYFRLISTCSGGSTNTSNVVSFTAVTCTSVPFSGSNTVACGTNGIVTDPGGFTGDYANSSSGYTVLENSGTGVITLSGTWSYLEGTTTLYDFVRIYSGTGIGGTLLYSYSGSAGGTITTFSSPVGVPITIQFTSDSSTVGSGFALNVAYSGTCNQCSASPSALTTSALSDTSATLSWTAAAIAPQTGYQYYYSTTNTAPAATGGVAVSGITANGTTTTANLSGLTISTPYYFWVRTYCSATDFGTWIPGTFTTLNALCAGTPVPGSITQTANIYSCTGVAISPLTLTGANPTSASGISYQWEQSANGTTGWGNAVGGSGANSTSYTPPNATAGTLFYRCKAICSNGGAFAYTSNTISVTVSVCTYSTSYTTSGVTFTSIMPANGGSGQVFPTWQGTSGDDNVTSTVPLTTTFAYQGTPITGLQASTNGWMTFNTTNTSSTYTNDLTSTGQSRVLAPFWDDLVLTGTAYANRDACMRYSTSNLNTGNGVITIEWAGMEKFNNAGPNLNFQVKLYENGNRIEYIYGSFEAYDGTATSSSAAYTYSIGYNGSSPSTVTSLGRFALQTANANHFSATSDPGSATTSVGVIMPACYSMFTFTPGVYTGLTSAPAVVVPSNNERAGAIALTVTPSAPLSLCGSYYTSKGATDSGAGQSCGTTAGNEDDDVWFKFNAIAGENYTIKLKSSPLYDGVLELFGTDGTTSIACVNATGAGLTESYNTTGLATGTYYVRAFHNGTTIGTSGGEFAITVNQLIFPPTNDEITTATNLIVSAACTPTQSQLPNTIAATASTTTPVPSCTGTQDDDVWYSFTATSTFNRITVQSGAGYNAAVSILSSSDNTATGTLTQLTCVNATGTGGIETYSGPFVQGSTYFIRVYHAGLGAATGNFTICVNAPVPACTTNTAPVNAIDTASITPTLTWTSATDASGYDIYLYPTAGPVPTIPFASTTTATTYTVPANLALSGLTAYTWFIVPTSINGAAPCTATNGTTFTTVSSCTAPSAITITIVDPFTHSVDLTWTAPTVGLTQSYQYILTTTNTPPASGVGATTITGTSVSGYTSVVPGTTYYLWVRTYCGTVGAIQDYSAWASSSAVNIPVVIPAPWLETFDGATIAGANGYTITTNGFVGNYVGFPGNPGAAITGEIFNSTALVFQTVNVGPVAANQTLSIDYGLFSTPTTSPAAGSGNFVVQISTDYGVSYTTLETVPNDGVFGYRTKSYPLNLYGGQIIRLRVTANRTSGDYIASFDNLRVQSPCTGTPSGGTVNLTTQSVCTLAPTPLTVTGASADVGIVYQWEQSISSGSWTNAVGGTGATTTTYYPPVYAGTPITYRLKTTCSTSTFFAYSNNSLVTGVPKALPFKETFDSLTTIGGWDGSSWYFYPSNSAIGNLGNNANTILYSGNAVSPLTTSPYGPIVAGQVLTLDYSIANTTTPYAAPASGTGSFQVLISTDCGANFSSLATVPNDGVAGYRTLTYPLSNTLVGQNVVIKIVGNWVSGNYSLSIDNLGIVTPPPTIASFAPTSLCAGTAGTIVITGTNFNTVNAVKIADVDVPYTIDSPTQITITIPSGNTFTTGLISVNNTANDRANSSSNFTFKPFPPAFEITGATHTLCSNLSSVDLDTDIATSGNLWTSSHPEFATVDSNGVVTGVGAGQSTIGFSVVNNGCQTFNTTPYVVTVNAKITITQQPFNVYSLVGNTKKFKVTATGDGTLTYQWYRRVSISSSTPVTNTPITSGVTSFSGATTNELTLTDIQASFDGYQYYCVVSTSAATTCTPVSSNGGFITIGNISFDSDPVSVSQCSLTPQTFTATVTSVDQDIAVTDLLENTLYRITSVGDTDFTLIGASSNAVGTVFTATGPGDGSGTATYVLTYKWGIDDPIDGYTPITDNAKYSGSSTLSLTVTPTVAINESYILRLYPISSDMDTTIDSNPATFSAQVPAGIGTQPANLISCKVNGTKTFTIATTGGVSSVQWQSSSTGSSPWTNVGTGTSLPVSVLATSPIGVTYYRALVNGYGSCPQVSSNTVTLTISQPTVSVAQSGAFYCTPGGTAVGLTASGTSATYAWSGTGLSSTTGAVVSATPNSTTTYTVTATDTNSCTNTATATVTVGNAFTLAVNSSPSAAVCAGTPVSLTSTVTLVDPTNVPTIDGYTFVNTTSPYATIVGGTGTTALTLNSSGAVAATDDGISDAQTLPFSFTFGGNSFTGFKMNTNGWITFDTSSTSYTNYASLAGTINNVIAAFSRDLDSNGTAGASYYVQTSGTTPNRITKLEWSNVKGFSGGIPATANAQIWLYEGSNNVEIHYGTFTPLGTTSTSTYSAQVGLRGASTSATDVKAITGTWDTPTTSADSSASIALGTPSVPLGLPVAGQVYKFIAKSAPPTNVYTYAWTSTPVGLTTNNTGATVSPTVTTTYNLTVSAQTGCSVSASRTVTVNPLHTLALSSGSPTQTFCINTPIPTNIVYAVGGGATGAGVTGLPVGMSGTYSAGQFTISGSPTGSGTFNFTVTTTGNACGALTATGTITITPNKTVSAASSSPTLCVNTALTAAITHTTLRATGIGTATGLPAGVTAVWASNTITISGTPTVSGIFNYSIPLTGGCGTVNATGTITVLPNHAIALLSGSATPTLCIGTTLATVGANTVYTVSGGATGAGVTGLPTGMSGAYAAGQFTISGTPSQSGTFNYTVTTTGNACVVASTTGTITVKANNTIVLSSAVNSDSQTVFINSAIVPITYNTTGATGATFAGLPTGVSGSWSGNIVTINGSPSVSGTSTYTVTLTGGCSTVQATGTITTSSLLNWYLDADGDHYYTGNVVVSGPSPGAGYTSGVGILGGGDCNDGVAAINPGATEICYNNIDDNCSLTLSEGCAPVVVNMTPSYNNTTLVSLSTAVPAVPYTYGSYTNLKYRFSIKNVTTGVTAADIIQTSRYVTIPAALHLYGATYTIKASAVINEEVVPYAGNTITVFAPTVEKVSLVSSSCGATLAALSSTLTANAGLNATGYTFRIRLNDANPSPTYAYSQSASRYVGANTFTGFPLQYGTSYKVSVQFTFTDPVTQLPVDSGYGAECVVNTPSIPLTYLASPTCGSQVAALNANISATSASYATAYQFRIRLASDNGPTPTYYYSVPNSSRFSSLTAFQGITYAYNTNYLIAVQYSILNGTTTVWSGYGPECGVKTPFFPTTSLVPSQCGLATPTSLTQQLNITPYPGFPNYKVKLDEISGESVVNSQEIVVSYSYFRLNQFSIAQAGKNYNVSVAIKQNGVFGDYSTQCDLFTASSKGVIVGPFKATAYPNPFADNFMIDVKTTSQSNVNLKVYDMVGRLIEQRDVRVSDMANATIGDRYPSGVYNVVVSQEDSVQTVRVVKR